MARECEIECKNCGAKSSLVEHPGWSDLNIDELEVGSEVKSMCMGECDDAVQPHEVTNIR